jgi:hypothetical protein
VNQRLSPLGMLWRDIESYLAANPGLFCFVRLAYPRGIPIDVPAEAEYGIMAEGQFRTVVFPNSWLRRSETEHPHLPHLRREAPCYIPGAAGRDSKGGSWV